MFFTTNSNNWANELAWSMVVQPNLFVTSPPRLARASKVPPASPRWLRRAPRVSKNSLELSVDVKWNRENAGLWASKTLDTWTSADLASHASSACKTKMTPLAKLGWSFGRWWGQNSFTLYEPSSMQVSCTAAVNTRATRIKSCFSMWCHRNRRFYEAPWPWHEGCSFACRFS